MHLIDVVTLTPETAGTVSVSAVAYTCRSMDVAGLAPQGAHYYHADVIYLLS